MAEMIFEQKKANSHSSEVINTSKELIGEIKKNIGAGIGNFYVRDPISALTHAIGFAAAIFLMPVLLIHAASGGATNNDMISLSIFMLSVVLLYGASTAYHAFPLSEAGIKRLKKLDHSMIFLLIAGSYTPICTIALPENTGTWMLSLVWGIAAAGIIFKLCWVTCPKWVSSVIYIAMGWVAIFAMGDILTALTKTNFMFLLLGGIAYTVGGVIYGMQKLINKKKGKLTKSENSKMSRYTFGAHEIFHVFVMAGTMCHYIVMYNII